MTFTSNGGQPPDAAAAANQAQLPQLNVLGQYVKDFSFENPNAPRSLAPSQEQPQLNVQINVGVNQSTATDYEVNRLLSEQAQLLSQRQELLSDLNRLGREPAVRKLAIDYGLFPLAEPVVLRAR